MPHRIFHLLVLLAVIPGIALPCMSGPCCRSTDRTIGRARGCCTPKPCHTRGACGAKNAKLAGNCRCVVTNSPLPAPDKRPWKCVLDDNEVAPLGTIPGGCSLARVNLVRVWGWTAIGGKAPEPDRYRVLPLLI